MSDSTVSNPQPRIFPSKIPQSIDKRRNFCYNCYNSYMRLYEL